MKLFKVFASIFFLAVLFFVVSLFFPRTYRIERSIEIGQPVETVFGFMADLRNWDRWSAWNRQLDPSMTMFYGRRSDSLSGRQYFYGDKLGSGRFEITGYVPGRELTYNLYMHGGAVSANGTFRFEPAGRATRLSWIDSGDVGYNPVYRYMVPSKVSSTTEAFDEGLARIKTALESNRP